MKRHVMWLVFGVVIGMLLGSVVVGWAKPDAVTGFEQRVAALTKQVPQRLIHGGGGAIQQGFANQVLTEQNYIIIDQNNEIIRLLQALVEQGRE